MYSVLRFTLLLLVLTSSQQLHAADINWYANSYVSGQPFGSPQAACDAATEVRQTQIPAQTVTNSLTFVSPTLYRCTLYGNGAYSDQTNILRNGDTCAPGTELNPTTGICEASPAACPEPGTTITAAVNCSLSGGFYVTPDTIAVEGCEYISNPTGYFKPYPNYNDPAKTFCMTTYASTGNAASPGESTPTVPTSETAPTPTPGDETPPCLTADGHTFCQDPEHPACGTRDGNPYCYGETDKCGELNGQFICLPNGSRSCTYTNGEYACVDSKTDTKIPNTSADHPDNGGNADGNPNNDAQAPDNVVPGGPQGTNGGATNKGLQDLKDALAGRLDAIGDALTKETESSPGAPVAPTERGNLDPDSWDQKIEDAKLELSTLTNQFGDLFQGVTNLNLSGSGGQLYCNSFTVMDRSYDLCLSLFSDQLAGIGTVILFLAALLAAYIIFIRD